jgi:hypothetical protein
MKDQKNNWLSLSSIGFQIAASLLLFGWLGYLIDKNFSLINHFGMVVGLLIVGIFSLYQIWNKISDK